MSLLHWIAWAVVLAGFVGAAVVLYWAARVERELADEEQRLMRELGLW